MYVCVFVCNNNNNNEYLEHLTRTGPKRLHVLFKYILSKFNACNINAHTHARTQRLAHAHTHTPPPPPPPVAYQGSETEEQVFKKKKGFKEDVKELTEVEWRTETGSWFQINGVW